MRKLLIFIGLISCFALMGQGMNAMHNTSHPITVSGGGGNSYADDFEAYSTGNLGGQGSWVVVDDNSLTVTDDAGNNIVTSAIGGSATIYNNTFANDQYSQVVLKTMGSTSFKIYVRLTGTGASMDGYAIIGKSGESAIYRIDDGVETKIGSWDFATNYSAEDILRLTAVGATLTFYVNAGLSLTTTDANYSSGQAGIGSSSGASTQIDDWEGGDL